MTEAERLYALTEYERPLWARGVAVGGMDEAGRGPLAGPVVAACVVLPSDPLIEGVNDSKKITERKREALYGRILAQCVCYGVGVAGQEVIDEINILQAARLAFKEAFLNARPRPRHVLVDAVKDLDIGAEQTAITGGDAKSYLIGAASIIAKVTRDRIMREYDVQYPQYGFAKHKGYGTKQHLEAIKEYGICPLHRHSFLKKYI